VDRALKQHFAEDIRLIVHAESEADARAVRNRLVNRMLVDDPALVKVVMDDLPPERLLLFDCPRCRGKAAP
jgi:hypothetical protein